METDEGRERGVRRGLETALGHYTSKEGTGRKEGVASNQGGGGLGRERNVKRDLTSSVLTSHSAPHDSTPQS